jgi:RNA recognition motif-containing protein
MLVTKENNEFKEIPTSKGFGYVCYEDPEAARAAKEALNEKFLPGYETWKRPLLVDYFMPKHERNTFVVSKINQFTGGNPKMPMGTQMFGNQGFNPMTMNMMNPNQMLQGQNFHPSMKFNPNMMMNPNMMGMGGFGGGRSQQQYPSKKPYQKRNNNQYNNQNMYQQPNKQIITGNQQTENKNIEDKDDINYVYLENLEDDSSKKEYLGEFIFKKIENHRLSHENYFTIDTIGKITGMILGIEDINEIVDICKNSENLTSRIAESWDLLGSAEK